MSSEIKVNSIQDNTGTRVLASDSGSAWSWGSGIPEKSVLQVVTNTDNTKSATVVNDDPWNYSQLNTAITLKKANSKVLVHFNFGAVSFQTNGQLGYGLIMFKIGSGSYSDLTPRGAVDVTVNDKFHHMAVNLTSQTYQVDVGASMIGVHTTSSAKDIVLTYAPYFYGEADTAKVFINQNSRNSGNDFSTISSCTLMEIAT